MGRRKSRGNIFGVKGGRPHSSMFIYSEEPMLKKKKAMRASERGLGGEVGIIAQRITYL